MSWFDNSFSFARTALSQAQKSIDKVLDISEGEVGIHEPTEQGSIYHTSLHDHIVNVTIYVVRTVYELV